MSVEGGIPQAPQLPRVFISYAWTDPEHQRWVIELATALRRDGVDVVLDVWDLGPGQDKYSFMERMVNDRSIDHVLVVCNPTYVAKADERQGGVGDETQIITPSLYANVDSQKFIPVLATLSPEGKPVLPAYLKTRIYVDLSTEQVYYEGYESLLRLVHGAPAFPKPTLGTKPEFLVAGATAGVPTSPLLRRALHALQNDSRTAESEAREFLSELSAAISALRIVSESGKAIDDQVLEAIHAGKQYRDEFIALLQALCRVSPQAVTERLLVEFLERLLQGCEHTGPGAWRESEFDGVRFLAMEIFLYTVATLLSRAQFDVLKGILAEAYVYEQRGKARKNDYGAFYAFVESIEQQRKQRLRLNRTSPVADLLKERADRADCPFERVQLAEFLLFVRSRLLHVARWHPRTLVFLNHSPAPFEVFLAPDSKRRFAILSAMLGVADPSELRAQLEEAFPAGRASSIEFGSGWQLSLRSLLNLSRPGDE